MLRRTVYMDCGEPHCCFCCVQSFRWWRPAAHSAHCGYLACCFATASAGRCGRASYQYVTPCAREMTSGRIAIHFCVSPMMGVWVSSMRLDTCGGEGCVRSSIILTRAARRAAWGFAPSFVAEADVGDGAGGRVQAAKEHGAGRTRYAGVLLART